MIQAFSRPPHPASGCYAPRVDFELANALGRIVELKDRSTAAHTWRVTMYPVRSRTPVHSFCSAFSTIWARSTSPSTF